MFETFNTPFHPCNLMNQTNPKPRPVPPRPVPDCPRGNMECYSLKKFQQQYCWRKEWILKKLKEIEQTPLILVIL